MSAGFLTATQALRNDAQKWGSISATLRDASSTASTLNISTQNWSKVVSETDLPRIYGEVQERLRRLLAEGEESASSLASNLNQIARDYETSDTAASRQYRGIWEHK